MLEEELEEKQLKEKLEASIAATTKMEEEMEEELEASIAMEKQLKEKLEASIAAAVLEKANKAAPTEPEILSVDFAASSLLALQQSQSCEDDKDAHLSTTGDHVN